jgi:hypothetical protein
LKYTVHGMSVLSWMMDFETEAPTDRDVWNEAAEQSSQVESQVMEQSNRILAVHPSELRCGLCPQDVQARRPKPKPQQP